MKNLVEVLLQRQTANNGMVFIQKQSETYISYERLARKSAGVLRAIRSLGIKPGDELVFQIEDSARFLELFWACLIGGIIPVPVTVGHNEEHRIKLLKIWNILNRPYLATTADIRNGLIKFCEEKELRQHRNEWADRAFILEDWDHIQEEEVSEIVVAKPDDIAFIQFSSGSTGDPKGVTLTHRNLLTNIHAIVSCSNIGQADSTLSWMPLTHDMGLIGCHLTPLVMGMQQYWMSTQLFVLNPMLWLEKTNEHRVTCLASPNFGYRHFLNHFRPQDAQHWDLSCVRLIFNGAEPISADLCHEFTEKTSPYRLSANAMFPVYGMAEASLAVTFPPPGEGVRQLRVDRSSLGDGNKVQIVQDAADGVSFVDLGSPVSDCDITIRDAEGNDLADGQIGTIYIQGGNVTKGYYNNPEATAASIRADGWLDTGDVGFVREGRLYVTGRKKDIIFVNGQNVYPHDLEAVGAALDGVELGKIAVSASRLGGRETDDILVFLQFRGKLENFAALAERVRREISAKTGHEVHLVIPVKHIPKTTSGKLQRYKLAEQYERGEFTELLAEFDRLSGKQGMECENAFASDTERTLYEIWRELIGSDRIGPDDSFLELGMHSLKAATGLIRIGQTFQVDLGFQDLLREPTIRGLARMIESKERVERVALMPAKPRDSYPITAAQYSVYMQEQHEGLGTTYNMPVCIDIEGQLEHRALLQALELLTARHEVLRTSFEWTETEPVQRVASAVSISIEVHERQQTEQEWLDSFIRPFDLSQAPLFRVGHIRHSEERHTIIWDFHHIIADGISVNVLLNELMELYRGNTLPAPALQYRDYAVWEQQHVQASDMQSLRAYWGERLSGSLPTLDMPTDFTRPERRTFVGNTLSFPISSDCSQALQQQAAAWGTTLHSLMFSAYLVLLHHYSGQEQLIVGSLVAGRALPETADMPGMFINYVPVRQTVNSSLTFQQLTREVHERLVQDYDHQQLPYSEMIRSFWKRNDPSRNPFFDTMLIMHHQTAPNITKGTDKTNWRLRPYPTRTAKLDFKLDLFAAEQGEWIAQLEYNVRLFRKETMEKMFGHYCHLLQQIIEQPERRVAELKLITPAEEEQILQVFNDTVTDFDRESTLDLLLERQAERTPDQIAVISEGRKWTYRELNGAANQLAVRLRDAGVGPDQIVAVLADRSPAMLVAVMAILKAGGAYLPVSPDFPEDRITFMMLDADVRVVLTDRPEQAVMTGAKVLDIRSVSPDDWADNVSKQHTSSNIAYVIYTSGSTGKPKGVMIEHTSVMNRLNWMQNAYPLTTQDVILQKTPFTFDVSVWELFWWTMVGASVCLLAPGGEKDPALLADVIENEQITTLHFVPSMLAAFLHHLEHTRNNHNFSRLRQVFASGEALQIRQVELFHQLVGKPYEVELINLYGPTEATVDVSYYNCEEHMAERSVPIGRPIDNIELYVLNESGQLQPVGVHGELCIGGVGVARGYWKRDALNEEKFVPNPFRPGERMYRTGDLTRWLPDGNLEYLGRLDFQVKLRGLRIELGEIETILLSYPGIRETVVTARHDAVGDPYLCAYCVSDNEWNVEALREYAAGQLPAYMIPSRFVQLAAMPLNANGKIDRKALPEPENTASDFAQVIAEPTDDVERALWTMWQEVLGLSKIGIDDNFFELGGHSLKAATLATRLTQQFEVALTLRDIFQMPTIRQLAERIRTSEGLAEAGIPRAPKSSHYPLSFAQERLFVLHQMDGARQAYNLPAAYRMVGALDTNRLKQAFSRLIERHETLRTSFGMHDGRPMQIVHEADAISFDINYQECGAKDVQERLRQFVQPFDLAVAPLFRVGLLRVDDGSHILLFDMHHIVADGVSSLVLAEELAALYEGKPLQPLPIQYKDFAAYNRNLLHEGQWEQEERYWLKTLGDTLPVLALTTDYLRPAVQRFEGGHIRFMIDQEVTEGVHRLARNLGVTPYMVLLAAYFVLLHRHTGQEDIIVGTPVMGRNHPDTQSLIGMFVNTVALRVQTEGHQSFTAMLNALRETVTSAFAGQEYPFEVLVNKLNVRRDTARNPVFDTMFVLQNMGNPANQLGDMQLTPLEMASNTSKFDVTLELTEWEAGLSGRLEYATSLFHEESARKLAERYETIVRQIVLQPELRIADIEMFTSDEQATLEGWNATAAQFPQTETLVSLFQEQVRLHPEHTAVTLSGSDIQMSYRELDEQSDELAIRLMREGVQPGVVVGLLAERSFELFVGVWGIVKAGGAYLPMSPKLPQERIHFMLKDSASPVLCTGSAWKDYVPDHYEGKTVCVDDRGTVEVTDLDKQRLRRQQAQPNDVAYLIYTSGSTGLPKGVMIEHRSIVNRLHWMQRAYPLDEQDVILQKTPITFDVSVWELFWWSLVGASVHLLEPDGEKDPQAIAHAVERYGVTVMHFVPSMLQLFLEQLGRSMQAEQLRRMRFVFTSGEALLSHHAEVFRSKLGQAYGTRLINLYGPTEATVDVSHYDCSTHPSGLPVPIGVPIDNTELWVLDANGKPQPIGVPGELCIGGVGVGRGYVERPELTAEKFVPHWADRNAVMYRTGDLARWTIHGQVEYLGRIDQQVKIRGFRIELGEIEHRLLQIPGIRETAVVAAELKGIAELVAYYVADQDLSVADLRSRLAETLPEYMIPVRYARVETMPLTISGKLDRKRLPDIAKIESSNELGEHDLPTSDLEQEIAAMWQQVLEIDRFSVHDNFFEVGGNSLALIRVHTLLDAKFPGQLTVTDLFACPTVAKTAERIRLRQSIAEREIVGLPMPDSWIAPSRGRQASVTLQTVLPSSSSFPGHDREEALTKEILAAYVLALARMSQKTTIPVQLIREEGETQAQAIQADLNGLTDHRQLLERLEGAKKTGGRYRIQEMMDAAKPSGMMIPAFVGTRSVSSGLASSLYDVVLGCKQESGKVTLRLDYDPNRMNKEAAKRILAATVSAQAAIEQGERAAAESAADNETGVIR